MSIKPYIMEDEEIIEYVSTDAWVWAVTDQRVLKYHNGGVHGGERMHDLSLEEISSISVVDTGRDERLLSAGLISIILGLSIPNIINGYQTLDTIVVSGGTIAVLLGGYLIAKWRKSDEAYFELNGSGVIQQHPERWRIQKDAADSPEEIQQFVSSVRSAI